MNPNPANRLRLPRTRAAWGTPHFERTFKGEIAALDPALLPLQEGLRHSTHALHDDVEAVLLGREVRGSHLCLRAQLFYKGIVAGCACTDDPTPQNEQVEQCEVEIEIHRATGEARIRLL